MLNTKFTQETNTNTKEDSNMSTTQTIKNKQALIQQATTELQTLTEYITDGMEEGVLHPNIYIVAHIMRVLNLTPYICSLR